MNRLNKAVTAGVGIVVCFLSGEAVAGQDLPHARGVVRANAETTLASELVARIAKLPFREGQRFKRGDQLVQYDCRRYAAELRAAKAEARALALTVRENEVLRKHRAVGRGELEVSRAKFEQANAKAEALGVRAAQCVIVAPFDGSVVERMIEVHEMPQANAPLMKLVDDSVVEINLVVPSKWLAWLKPGMTFGFKVDETGATYRAKVDRMGATIDAISQTIRIIATFEKRPSAILPGMSGTATFDQPTG
ncbi:MAG: efflux RND transporter periplasmic adaptor subunit [Pseudomonadota bacterium]